MKRREFIKAAAAAPIAAILPPITLGHTAAHGIILRTNLPRPLIKGNSFIYGTHGPQAIQWSAISDPTEWPKP